MTLARLTGLLTALARLLSTLAALLSGARLTGLTFTTLLICHRILPSKVASPRALTHSGQIGSPAMALLPDRSEARPEQTGG
jgi:hypothetical protein